jgi:hypothetical protein
MNKKIIITEEQEQKLLEHLITEQQFPIDPKKVLIVKNYLDKNFKRGNISEFGNNGLPVNNPVVGLLNNGEVVKNLNARQLFDLLEDEFRNMFSNKIQRSKFLARVIQDWYANNISKEGLLSTTNC